MSSLCCCWNRKAAEAEEAIPATGAAAEMQEVEVARTADGESGDNTKPSQSLPEVIVSSGPRKRRRSRAQLTDEEAGEEAWLLDPAPGDGEDSVQEAAEGLDNSNCFVRTWAKKEELFYTDLLDRINGFRAIEARLPPLRVSKALCQHAITTWCSLRKREGGFAAVSNCYVSTFIPDASTRGRTGQGLQIDCLTYWDLPYHYRLGVPAAAVHYWSTNGSYTANVTKVPWNPRLADNYPIPDSTARGHFDGSRHMFRPILLDEHHKFVGLYFGKSGTGLSYGALRHSVVALFA